MTDVVTLAYFVAALGFLMGPTLYLTYRSLGDETHTGPSSS